MLPGQYNIVKKTLVYCIMQTIRLSIMSDIDTTQPCR